MTTAPLALVDINNAYASFERIFDPGLQRRGVLVVGSNDANIVARSAEVKALGIPMGAPLEGQECQQVAALHDSYGRIALGQVKRKDSA